MPIETFSYRGMSSLAVIWVHVFLTDSTFPMVYSESLFHQLPVNRLQAGGVFSRVC